MPLSPEEVQRQEFDQSKHGYDRDQVRRFLNTVASDYRSALAESNYEAVGDEVGKILQTVNDSAAALRAKAASEAEEILAQAASEASKVRQGAQSDADRLRSEAEAETQALRERTDQQVRVLVTEAEQRVVELEAKVRKETEDRIREADKRVDSLKQAERDLIGRLDRAREMLESVTAPLRDDSDDTTPATESVALETGEESEPATAP